MTHWTEPQQQDFDSRIKMAEAALRAAVSGPPMEMVAVKLPGGGYEMKILPVFR
jgi:hypothetical protein